MYLKSKTNFKELRAWIHVISCLVLVLRSLIYYWVVFFWWRCEVVCSYTIDLRSPIVVKIPYHMEFHFLGKRLGLFGNYGTIFRLRQKDRWLVRSYDGHRIPVGDCSIRSQTKGNSSFIFRLVIIIYNFFYQSNSIISHKLVEEAGLYTYLTQFKIFANAIKIRPNSILLNSDRLLIWSTSLLSFLWR